MLDLLPILATTWNETLVSDLSSLIGSGLQQSYGSTLLVGIFVLLAVFGTLYALGFTLDVTIVIVSAVVLLMSGLNAINTSGFGFNALPSYLGFLVLFVIGAVVMFAIIKLARR